MNVPTLTRRQYTPPKGQDFVADMTLVPGRAHEFCGPARRTLALMLAARMEGPVFWIRTRWDGDRLHGPGVVPFMDPARLTFVEPERREDLLWCTEEVLRTGAIGLVVTELPEPPPLTPVRRLHLAAEAGGAGSKAPIAVLLTPENGGAQGAESRWHLAPAHGPEETRWRLGRRRARMAPQAEFDITWTCKRAQLAKEARSA
ncbi:MAG: hypothetical protein AAFR98_11245 [Pseudomonadota bacterium]